MPELPDIVVYIEALEKRILGETLQGVRIVSPFLLRTANPPLGNASGKKILRLRRIGKKIAVASKAKTSPPIKRNFQRGVTAALPACLERRRKA